MSYNYAKERAHLKRAAWHDSHGNTQKALAHFGRALYFGAKRGRESGEVGGGGGRAAADKKLTSKESSDLLDRYVASRRAQAALDEITGGLGAMDIERQPHAQPARRMSHYGR